MRVSTSRCWNRREPEPRNRGKLRRQGLDRGFAAVPSEYFAVGAVVPWLRAGVGAVATQAIRLPRVRSSTPRGGGSTGITDGGRGGCLARRSAASAAAARRRLRRRGDGQPHERQIHRLGRQPSGARLRRLGQHHGRRGRCRGDGARFRGGRWHFGRTVAGGWTQVRQPAATSEAISRLRLSGWEYDPRHGPRRGGILKVDVSCLSPD
jgi:hypothetical protein